MARRAELTPELLDRARRRDLTRSNTEPGTPERQAVDRATYLRRRDRKIGPTAREALGHQKPGYRPAQISFFAEGPPRRIVIEGLSRRDVRRAARYDAFVGNLRNGRLSRAPGHRPQTGCLLRRICACRPARTTEPMSHVPVQLPLGDLGDIDQTLPRARPHPAPFTDSIIERFAVIVHDYAAAGARVRVLDPFAGIGGIHKIPELLRAGDVHVDTVGVELEPGWASRARAHARGECAGVAVRAGLV